MFSRVTKCLFGECPKLALLKCIKYGTSQSSCRSHIPQPWNVLHRTTTTSSVSVKYSLSYHSQITLIGQFTKKFNASRPSIVRCFSQSTEKLPYEKDFKIAKNVLVYSNGNDRFYRFLSYFGAIQFIFWSYLGMFCYSSLRDVSYSEQEKADAKNAPWWRLINLGQNKYKNGIALLCFVVGYTVLFITVMFPLRAVQSLWLLKGGKSVGITTYAPFGNKTSLVAPLENINCVQSRAQAQSQVPLKIKGKWFFYLLDHKGVYHNPDLFDYAVGLKRRL